MTTLERNFLVKKGLVIGEGASVGDTFSLLLGRDPTANLEAATKQYVDNAASGAGGTTYDIDASATTGGVNLNLNGSNAITDSVKFESGTNVTITSPDANTILISSSGGGGGGITYVKKTANYTAASGDGIIADTSGGSFTITLPATPTEGDQVILADGADWTVNNLTVARNGSTIEGDTNDLSLDIGNIQVTFIYDGTTWQVYAVIAPTAAVYDDTTTNTTQYLTMSRVSSGSLNDVYVSSTKLYFNPFTGAISSTDFNALSDNTLKEKITPLVNAQEIIDKIEPVSFLWKDTGQKAYGVIAQEIEKILPELVQTNSDTGIKTVSYMQLIPFLLQAVKELSQEVAELKRNK